MMCGLVACCMTLKRACAAGIKLSPLPGHVRQVKQHEAELDALKRALRVAGDAQASEYARGRSEAAAEAAPLRDAAAAVPRLQADLAKTRAALQEQLVRASSFDESEMLDRRVVKKLLVSEVALSCHWCFMWPPYAWCFPGGHMPRAVQSLSVANAAVRERHSSVSMPAQLSCRPCDTRHFVGYDATPCLPFGVAAGDIFPATAERTRHPWADRQYAGG